MFAFWKITLEALWKVDFNRQEWKIGSWEISYKAVVVLVTDDAVRIIGEWVDVFFLNWSIVALQCCISVCCTAEWISNMYKYIPSSWDCLPFRWPQSTEFPNAIQGKWLDLNFERRANRTCYFNKLVIISFSFLKHCAKLKAYILKIISNCCCSKISLILFNHIMELSLFFRDHSGMGVAEF